WPSGSPHYRTRACPTCRSASTCSVFLESFPRWTKGSSSRAGSAGL
ncbi:unnamed protein product, partial [Ixodes persulcatus]